ncbi:MAG: hypothetical protein H6697_11710 [Myxococcales bacterium]|nr:hypothetical protein [Myxococcales bacterium]
MHWKLQVVAVIGVLAAVGTTAKAYGQECEPNPTVIDNGCAGCSTNIDFMCETLGGECDGCSWTVNASITCTPPIIQTWVGGASLQCGDKYEYRFGGCGSGAWGGVVCDCIDCPEAAPMSSAFAGDEEFQAATYWLPEGVRGQLAPINYQVGSAGISEVADWSADAVPHIRRSTPARRYVLPEFFSQKYASATDAELTAARELLEQDSYVLSQLAVAARFAAGTFEQEVVDRPNALDELMSARIPTGTADQLLHSRKTEVISDGKKLLVQSTFLPWEENVRFYDMRDEIVWIRKELRARGVVDVDSDLTMITSSTSEGTCTHPEVTHAKGD